MQNSVNIERIDEEKNVEKLTNKRIKYRTE